MKIFLVILISITITKCDFPSNPLKASMFDASNGFIDSMNNHLFSLNGMFQTKFDTAVATTWMYWRLTVLSANTRGFVTASENRTELTDCLASYNDVIGKVITHLTNDVMKPIFDIRQTDTKIEDDLSKQMDEIKDIIMRANNLTCLKNVPYNDYNIGLAYYKYSSFLARSFANIAYRTDLDYNSRFFVDHFDSTMHLFKIRSSIMIAKTRYEYNSFIRNYCKPQAFAKFENLIESANNVINDCAKRIYNVLNEALDQLPSPNPFLNKLAECI